MSNTYRLKTLAAALALVFAQGTIASPSQSALLSEVTVAYATQLSQNDTLVGPLALTQSMHIVVALKLRNKPQLDALLAVSRFAPMSSAQFETQYSPTQAQAQKVANFLINAGFKNVTIAPNRLLVSGDAPVAFVQRAFKTSMVRVHTHDGRDAFAHASGVAIPAALQAVVQSVLGLQTVHIAHTITANAGLVKPLAAKAFSITGHDPTEFASIYDAIATPTASTIPVGIIAEGSMANVLNDLNTFTKNNSLPTVATQVVGNGGSDTSGDIEWDLDSQDIVGMSGGVQKLVFYTTSSLSNANLTSDLNAAVSANTVKVINVSLGECERYMDSSQGGDGSAQAEDQIFEQAVAQGQTFSVSSGDSGANECAPNYSSGASYPASSPYVVAVGGTTLDASSTVWNGETVWNDPSTPSPPSQPPCHTSPRCPKPPYLKQYASASATGGSPSSFEPMPVWQQGVGQNLGHSTRGVPDVAFDASPSSGALVFVDGQQEQVGGTSLASPLFVGAWARLLAAKGSNLGFAAPLLYRQPQGDFHDITQGNNNGETAAAGWDYTTGLGSMIVDDFMFDLHTYEKYADINEDGKSDLLWHNSATGELTYWLMDGNSRLSWRGFNMSNNYWPPATGDFDGNGRADVVWMNDGGQDLVWFGNGSTFTSISLGSHQTKGWVMPGTGDALHSGKSNLFWYSPDKGSYAPASGEITYWLMSGTSYAGFRGFPVTTGWRPLAIGDFNGDGYADILFATSNDTLSMWLGDGTGNFRTGNYVDRYPNGWVLVGDADANADGKSDLIWFNPNTGELTYWLMNGATRTDWSGFFASNNYYPIATGDYTGDHRADILWTSPKNDLYMWLANGSGGFTTSQYVDAYPTGWQPVP